MTGNGLAARKTRRFTDLSDRPMWLRVLLHVLGVVLLILGIIGFFLPILQGFLFTFLGILVLAGVNPWLRRKVDGWLDRHPKMDRMYWKTILFAQRLRPDGRGKACRARRRERAAKRKEHAAAGHAS
jgi:uncharacterized protein